MDGKRESEKSVLSAWLNDDNVDASVVEVWVTLTKFIFEFILKFKNGFKGFLCILQVFVIACR